jgi:hypothetical protein
VTRHGDSFLDRLEEELAELVKLIVDRIKEHNRPPTEVVLKFPTLKGNTMSNISLALGVANIGAITAADDAGVAVPVTFDPGSVVATLSDDSATAVVSLDQLSVSVTGVSATVVGSPNVLSVAASVGGVALKAATQTFDVVAGVAGGAATQVVLNFAAATAPGAPSQALGSLVAAASVPPTHAQALAADAASARAAGLVA